MGNCKSRVVAVKPQSVTKDAGGSDPEKLTGIDATVSSRESSPSEVITTKGSGCSSTTDFLSGLGNMSGISSVINTPFAWEENPGHYEDKNEDRNMALQVNDDEEPTVVAVAAANVASNIVEATASDDGDLCPTVIMDERTIEIVNSTSSSNSSGKISTWTQKYLKPFLLDEERQGVGHLVTCVNRVALVVSDIEQSVAFYTLLGFERSERPGYLKEQNRSANSQHEAWLKFMTFDLHLRKGTPAVQSGENPVLSFYVSKTQKAIQLLRNTNIPFVVNITRNGAGNGGHCRHSIRQVFFRDPDGRYIEFSNCQEGSGVRCTTESTSFDLHQPERSESVVVSNVVRRWLRFSDLRSWQSDAEVELSFYDETKDTVFQTLSEGNITGPGGFLNVAEKSKRNQRLVRSKSTTYVDVLKANGIPLLEVNGTGDETEESDSPHDMVLGSVVESVNCLSLIVSNADKSLKFYTDVLGLQQIQPGAGKSQGVCLTAGSVSIHLVEGKPEVESGDDTTVVDGKITLDVKTIEEAYKKLQDMKVPFRVKKTYGLIEAYIRDPDGYYIVFGNYNAAASAFEQGVAESEQRSPTEAEQETKPLPLALQPTAADLRILKNFMRRRKIDGDICHYFRSAELKQILCEAGNDAPTAILLMQHRIEEGSINESAPTQVVDNEGASVSADSGTLCCGCYSP